MLQNQVKTDICCPGSHFEYIHATAQGTVLIWEPNSENQWHKLQPGDPQNSSRLAAQENQFDRYCTVNEFNGWRLVKLLKSLRACYVDLDGFTDLETAQDVLTTSRMPAPSICIWSGRGLHLYWLLQPTPAKSLPVWQEIQNTLIQALLNCGADRSASDCTRLLRLAGSINSKNGKKVSGQVLTGARWSLHQLSDEVLGARPKRSAKVRELRAIKSNRPNQTKTGLSRWHLVHGDLITIAKQHGRIPEGFRNKWLFLFAVSLSWITSPENLRRQIEHAAQAWAPNLPHREIDKIVQPAIERAVRAAAGCTVKFREVDVDSRHRIKRKTLFEWMEPLIDKDMHLRAIIPDEVKAARDIERQKRRDRAIEGRYKTKNTGRGIRVVNLEKRNNARCLKKEGMTMRAIAKRLDVSLGTVWRWLSSKESSQTI